MRDETWLVAGPGRPCCYVGPADVLHAVLKFADVDVIGAVSIRVADIEFGIVCTGVGVTPVRVKIPSVAAVVGLALVRALVAIAGLPLAAVGHRRAFETYAKSRLADWRRCAAVLRSLANLDTSALHTGFAVQAPLAVDTLRPDVLSRPDQRYPSRRHLTQRHRNPLHRLQSHRSR